MQRTARQAEDSHHDAHQRALNTRSGAAAPELLEAALCFQFTTPADGQVPEWVEVIPAPGADGQIKGRDGRSWKMPDAGVVASRLDIPVPVDINHATELLAPKGGEAPAQAWVEKLEARNGALWAKAAWNKSGADKVSAREYRFLSPVFDFVKSTGEIFRLKSVGLVNDPNFSLALNSRAGTTAPEDVNMKLIAAALKLPETATEAEIIAAINTRETELSTARNAAQTPDLAKFVPRADHDAVLARATNAEQKLADQERATQVREVDAEIDAAVKAGKITPATREYHRAMCMAEGGLQKFRDYVKAAPVIVSEGERQHQQAQKQDGALTDQQRAICRNLGISEEEYSKNIKSAA